MLNPGLLDRILSALSATLLPGWGLLENDVLWLLGVMGTIYLLVTLTYAMGGMLDRLPVMCIALAKYLGYVWVLMNFQSLTQLYVNMCAAMGLLLSRSSMTVDDVASPGRVLWQGQHLMLPLIEHINGMSWLGYAKYFVAIQFMTVAMWISWGAFVVLALHLFYVQVTFQLSALINFLKIAFGIFEGTAGIMREGAGNILHQGLRVAVVALVAGAGVPWMSWLAFPAGEEPGYWSAMAMILGSWTLVTLSLAGPRALEAHAGAFLGTTVGTITGAIRGMGWLRRTIGR